MSNKKRKTRSQKINYQQGKLLKIKELNKLRIEIIDLEKKIKEQNKKQKIKNLKICSNIFKRIVMPITLATGISLGAGSIINVGLPFKQDKIAKVKEIKIDYETGKTFNINEKYVLCNGLFDKNTKKSSLKIYFPYEKNDSNEYEQVIRTYKLTEEDVEKIYEALLESNLKDVIEDLDDFKEKTKTIEEITETNKGYVVKCNLNIAENYDKLYVEESFANSIAVNILYILVILILSLVSINFSDFKTSIININNEYKIISLDELKESLENKKSKYLDLKKRYNL